MLFENAIKPGLIACYISEYVVQEISNTLNPDIREKLLDVLAKYPIDILEISQDEVEAIAKLYIDAGVIPVKKIYDAYHLAVATLAEMNYVLSWNFKHLANIKREAGFNAVNLLQGYRPVRILTPMELIYGDPEEKI